MRAAKYADPTIREHSPLNAVAIERIKQDVKWGEQRYSDAGWLPILIEEVGEVGEMVCEITHNPEADGRYVANLEYELIQVAAVCIAWIEAIRKRDIPHDNPARID
jgi:hypothetical protein